MPVSKNRYHGEKPLSQLAPHQLKEAVRIEAWAEEMVRRHRRECTEAQCGGRSKMWWVVRHPNVTTQQANQTAKAYVRSMVHVCAPLLTRLVDGQLDWIDGERESYEKRTDEEIMRMLGREFSGTVSAKESESFQDDPFPEAMDAMPDAPPSTMRARDWHNQQRLLKQKEAAMRSRPAEPQPGVVDFVSALRKKNR